MKADVFPENLRDALRDKLTVWSCSNRQASVIFGVTASCVANWVNGKTKSLTPLNKAKIAFFATGCLDNVMDWLRMEADLKPKDASALCRSLFKLGNRIQCSQQLGDGGKSVVALKQDVDALVKKTLAAEH